MTKTIVLVTVGILLIGICFAEGVSEYKHTVGANMQMFPQILMGSINYGYSKKTVREFGSDVETGWCVHVAAANDPRSLNSKEFFYLGIDWRLYETPKKLFGDQFIIGFHLGLSYMQWVPTRFFILEENDDNFERIIFPNIGTQFGFEFPLGTGTSLKLYTELLSLLVPIKFLVLDITF
ncbi:MAG: hypothetical protein Q8M98_05045 [Candidatus Cloacimonadaceae bacterium]|nr:hypothetical protein [Candidatus Cloacimonadaceae bacterium]